MTDISKDKKINKRLLVKSGIWYTLSNFLTRAMAFITIPIFTRLMTKEQYGNFSVFAGWQSIFLIICGFEIYATLNRARFDFEGENELNSYITSCLALSTFLTSAALLLYLLMPHFFNKLFMLERKYIWFMFAYLYTQPAFQMFQAKQRIEYRYKFSAVISFLLIVGSTSIAVLLVHILDDSLMGRIFGQYVLYAVAGIAFYIYFFQKSHVIRFRNWKYAVMLGLPLVVSFLDSQILLTADRIIVKQIGAEKEVAWIVLATSCTHIILIFVQTLNNTWAPWFYDKMQLKSYDEIRGTFRIYIWFIIFCTFISLIIGPELIAVLGGREYRESIYVLPANMLCGVFTALSSQFVNLETYYKKTHYSAVLTFVAAAVNIVGDVAGVTAFGYEAACYVTVMCQLLLVFMHYIAAQKMNIQRILPFRELFLMLATSLTLIPISLILYRINVIRFILISFLIIAVCAAIVIKRKSLLSLIKIAKNK